MEKHFAVPVETTLQAAEEQEARRLAERVAEVDPPPAAAANLACADCRPQLISG